MSERHETQWGPSRCHLFAEWLNRMLELEAVKPHCRPAPEPRTQTPGIVVEWSLYTRQVELHLAFTGAASIILRDGPADFRPLPDWIDRTGGAAVLDAARDAVWWMERRRDESCPPKQ